MVFGLRKGLADPKASPAQKTKVVKNTKNPVFKDTLTLALPPGTMATGDSSDIWLNISLWDKDYKKGSHRNLHGSLRGPSALWREGRAPIYIAWKT